MNLDFICVIIEDFLTHILGDEWQVDGVAGTKDQVVSLRPSPVSKMNHFTINSLSDSNENDKNKES